MSAPNRRPGGLPHQLTSFVGREREVRELLGILREARLVTVAGAAGMGKTRIALEVAAALAAERPDGVHFVSFAGISEPAKVPQVVAAALGVREQSGAPLLDTLAGEVGDEPTLLLLDNCEHVLDSTARLAEFLLRSCAGLRLLATSHEPLRVPGEVVWRIPPLSLPEPDRGGRPPVDSESERLFAARAALASSFTMDEHAARTVAQICLRLDGIPLAIELAAARAEVMSVDDILERLEDRFRLLTAGSRTAMPRHQTLRAALDWGHQLLDDPGRRLLRRLSVFAGGFDLAAAEVVCGDRELNPDELVNHLSRLVDKSFAYPEPRGSGPTRFRMLETVRQYAAERLLESGEADRIRFRHADHYRGVAERAQRYELSSSQALWLARLESDHDNLRAALDWCRAHDPGRWLRMAASLGWFWVAHGHLAEGQEQLRGVLALGSLDPGDRARGFLWLARLQYWEGDHENALRLCEQSLAIYRELGDEFGAGWPLNLTASILMYRGSLEEARAMFAEVAATAPNLDVRIDALMGLGEAMLQLGDLAAATARLEESIAAGGGPDSRVRGATAVMLLGIVDSLEGRRAAARARLRECLDVFHRAGHRYAIAAALDVVAALDLAEGEPERTLRLCAAAAELRVSMNAPLAPNWTRILDSAVIEPARAAAGVQAAAAAWEEGRRMSTEEVLAYAQAPAAPGPPAPALPEAPEQRGAGLSRRERQVAAMVARGMTNRQIADQLVLAERTIEGHVERIRGKLGVHSRTQIAVWVVEGGMAPAAGGTEGPLC